MRVQSIISITRCTTHRERRSLLPLCWGIILYNNKYFIIIIVSNTVRISQTTFLSPTHKKDNTTGEEIKKFAKIRKRENEWKSQPEHKPQLVSLY